MDITEALRHLPRVGDRRMEYPSPKAFDQAVPQREKCVVTEVNYSHLWYRVQFINTGFFECYKVPDLSRRK